MSESLHTVGIAASLRGMKFSQLGNDKLDPERQSIYPCKVKLVQRFGGYLGEAEGVKK